MRTRPTLPTSSGTRPERRLARLRQIEGKLPPKMQQLCDTLCLHDAEIVSVDFSGGANGDRTPVASLASGRTTDWFASFTIFTRNLRLRRPWHPPHSFAVQDDRNGCTTK